MIEKIITQFLIILGCIFFVGIIGLSGFAIYKFNQNNGMIQVFQLKQNENSNAIASNFNLILEMQKQIKELQSYKKGK